MNIVHVICMEVEVIFRERGENSLDVPMTALTQLFDDIVFVDERRIAQFSQRREEVRIARRRLGVHSVSTPAGEQQQ